MFAKFSGNASSTSNRYDLMFHYYRVHANTLTYTDEWHAGSAGQSQLTVIQHVHMGSAAVHQDSSAWQVVLCYWSSAVEHTHTARSRLRRVVTLCF